MNYASLVYGCSTVSVSYDAYQFAFHFCITIHRLQFTYSPYMQKSSVIAEFAGTDVNRTYNYFLCALLLVARMAMLLVR